MPEFGNYFQKALEFLMGIGLEALAYRNHCSWEIRLFYNYDTLRLYLQACGKRQKHMGARHSILQL